MDKWRQFKFVCFIFIFLSGCLLILYTVKEYQSLGRGLVPITTITCRFEEGAPFLADLFVDHLGLDGPELVLMRDFSVGHAKRQLQGIPILKHSKVKVVKPGIISIEYILRSPVAFMGDVENCVFDGEGCCFPFSPFYAPRGLPEVFFGLSPGEGTHAYDFKLPHLEYALDLLHYFEERKWLGQLLRVTLSRMQKKENSKKEIIFECIAQLPCGSEKHVVRIHPQSYEVAKKEYVALMRTLQGKVGKEIPFLPYKSLDSVYRIIDLRVAGQALLLTNLEYEG